MKKTNNAPIYAAMYPELSEIARKCGYAMAVHGSVARDFDLICIPWIKKPKCPKEVVNRIINEFSLSIVGQPEKKLHNREAWTLVVGFGECFLDLSFMPIIDRKK